MHLLSWVKKWFSDPKPETNFERKIEKSLFCWLKVSPHCKSICPTAGETLCGLLEKGISFLFEGILVY